MHISELASEVDETPRTIRFYESIALLPDPERETNGYRNYDDYDCDRVRLIRTFQAGLVTRSQSSEPNSPTFRTSDHPPRSAPWLPTDADTNRTT